MSAKEARKKRLAEYQAKKLKEPVQMEERQMPSISTKTKRSGSSSFQRSGSSSFRRSGSTFFRRSGSSSLRSAPGAHKGTASLPAVLQVLYLRRKQKQQAKRWQNIRYYYNNNMDLNDNVNFNDEHAFDDDHAEQHVDDDEYHYTRDAAIRHRFYNVRDPKISADNYHAARNLLRFSKYTDYPFLYDWRWEAIAGMERNSVMGKGDLIFTDGKCRFAVVKLGVWTKGSESSYPASDAYKFLVRDQQDKSKALRHARIFERFHPRVRHIVPMLKTNDGLYMYQEGEWSMYRNNRGWPPMKK